ncbi:hypothetical protein SPHV1_620015 [Novosphingobium sp. KN65.2]|nr:hypothetical protein SPHV1_620015 [Novosphingobium sp. KN65.2]
MQELAATGFDHMQRQASLWIREPFLITLGTV